MAKKMRLSVKLLSAFVFVGIVPFAVVAVLTLQKTTVALNRQVFGQLESVREVKRSQIEEFFKVWEKQMIVAKDGGTTVKGLAELRALKGAGFMAQSDVWEAQVKIYEKAIGRYCKEFGWGDFYFILDDGYIIYSAKRESDLGKYLSDPLLKDTNLAQVFSRAKELKAEEIAVSDIRYFAPAGVPAGFMIGKILDETGTLLGYAAMEMSIDQINNVMLQREGLGKTGETYLVGSDNLMRSDSYLDPAAHSVKASLANPDKGKVATKAVAEALAGKKGTMIGTNYRGDPVLCAYAPVKVGSMTWALIAERNIDEASAEVKTIRVIIGLIAVIGIAVIILISLSVTGSITRPVNQVIKSLTNGADQTSAAAGQVSSASQHLSQNTSEQAASLEETSSSLDEINTRTKQTTDSTAKVHELSQQAFKAAEQGSTEMTQMQVAMGQINDSSTKISKIIKTIEEIAFQTNLLALNAAVEAARAGEHGKGFAVVAEEVRNLAKRSAEAAKDTASLIEDNVQKTKNGTGISQKVGQTLNAIMEHSKKVLDIISEVNTATGEQAEAVAQITRTIMQLNQVTQQNASAAEETASSSEELTSQAESMQHIVHQLQEIVGGSNGEHQISAAVKQLDERRHPVLPGKSVDKTAVSRKNNTQGIKITDPKEVIPLEKDRFKDF